MTTFRCTRSRTRPGGTPCWRGTRPPSPRSCTGGRCCGGILPFVPCVSPGSECGYPEELPPRCTRSSPLRAVRSRSSIPRSRDFVGSCGSPPIHVFRKSLRADYHEITRKSIRKSKERVTRVTRCSVLPFVYAWWSPEGSACQRRRFGACRSPNIWTTTIVGMPAKSPEAMPIPVSVYCVFQRLRRWSGL